MFKKQNWFSVGSLIIVLVAIIIYCIFQQFLTPTFIEPDEYYHVTISGFIRDFGPRYNFRWARFSTFKNSFSDKEFLFHLFIIPFLTFSKNIVLNGKYAIIFYNLLFILIYIFLLRRYIPEFLVACLILIMLMNFYFFTYFIRLRPVTLANILTVLGIYFLINKRWKGLFIISFLYPLSHISFLTLLIFVLGGEYLRYRLKKEFFIKNVSATVIGLLLGCLLHPNHPNNWLSTYLNFLLVPYYTSIKGLEGFGNELYSTRAKELLIGNSSLFLSLLLIIWVTFISKVKLSLGTIIWWFCFIFYLLLSFLGTRYTYPMNALFFIFFASFLSDWLQDRPESIVILRTRSFLILYGIIIVIFFYINIKGYIRFMMNVTKENLFYEDTAKWLNFNIPAGSTIYHADWSSASCFMCFNPKNNYLLFLDPIYMLYKYPKLYKIYLNLNSGKTKRPYKILRHIFKIKYGYTEKSTGLYHQIKEQDSHFKILYENELGVVFEVL
ncbi:MAG: hypothetical protein NC912_05510 [Candidatus Omnitrophica bacterium]|nr:hypothetical protein [Candidatus Omnitrophota bacterium]